MLLLPVKPVVALQDCFYPKRGVCSASDLRLALVAYGPTHLPPSFPLVLAKADI